MPALRKPHRVAVLMPDVTIEGPDVGLEPEAALLLWVALIEVCQRHPMLAVYDPESTPVFPHEGHFAPAHAVIGATPADAFYGSTRRDELIWLELKAPKPGAVRLHVLGRDGAKQTFDAIGKNIGDQVQQVLTAWLSARGLAALPKRFEAVSGEELIAVVKTLAPLLVDEARAWATTVKRAQSESDLDAQEEEDDEEQQAEDDPFGELGETVAEEDEPVPAAAAVPAVEPAKRKKVARPVANRLPAPLKLAALRTLSLAIREELDDLILAVDPEQPQALFAKFEAGEKDVALLRRVIAAAPCWARPYGELARPDDAEEGDATQPTELETVAGAGIAALCRPAHLEMIERVSTLLHESGLTDEAVRLLERAVATHFSDSRAHIALVEMVANTDREGAQLRQAHRSGRVHGCPMDSAFPWYPDQIQIDLLVANALLRVGRLDEAIALRGNRLEGREAQWPRHTKILNNWRKDPRFVAWCYAAEGYYRGDPARTVEGFGRIQPGDDASLAAFMDALVAMGREDEVLLAWAQYGQGARLDGPVARLGAARCLFAAGEWRRGLDELWRVELTEPGRDEHVAFARCGLMLSCAPIQVAELALGEKVAIGANTLARRMARDIADFVPGAAGSSVVTRALGKLGGNESEPMLGGFAPTTRSKKAIDALFAAIGPLSKADDALARADRLVNGWLEVVFSEASEEDEAALAQAACYAAAQALSRYLTATTLPATPIAGALRMVAGEALALVRVHQSALVDRDAKALLAAVEPVLRRADRWVASNWLGTIERSLGIDERSGGDVAGFAGEAATIAARVLGPEESAVLAASIARLVRERPNNWAAAVNAQAMQLALHTGYLGADEWADSVIALLAAKELDVDSAIDELHTCCYLVEGQSAVPALHAARVLLDAGRGPAALQVLTAGLAAAGEDWRDEQIASLADAWNRVKLDVPLAFEKLAAQMFEALQKGDPARAERLGRFSVAYDPTNAEAHRNLGLAYAQQGKVAEAMPHLVRGTREQATQILSGVLYQSGNLPAAMAVLDYASRWYNRADQWLTYGGIAYAAMDNPRTVKSYALAYQLDPQAFDTSQLNAYAGVLDEVGDYPTCQKIAEHLLRAAGDDVMWKTNGWNHLACAYIGLGRFDEAVKLASDAVKQNPLPDNAGNFATTLERAKTKTQTTPPPLPPIREMAPVFALLEAGELGPAEAMASDPSWRVRRAALEASRFRFGSENAVDVTPRARAAATAMLAATVGVTERDAVGCRALALLMREQAYFARDPVPFLGDRPTRDAFYTEFRARGGVVLGDDAPPPPKFEDRIVVPGAKIERISDYVALLRDLAALTPGEAIAQFDLDEAGYMDVAKQWAAAIDKDASIARAIGAGLAKR